MEADSHIAQPIRCHVRRFNEGRRVPGFVRLVRTVPSTPPRRLAGRQFRLLHGISVRRDAKAFDIEPLPPVFSIDDSLGAAQVVRGECLRR
jgi:hypothetical protein